MNKFEERLKEEAANPEACLWMSFCDPTKPSGEQFIGVVVTYAKGMIHAIDKLNRLDINPGGDVAMYETNPLDINAEDFDKLLTKEYLIESGYIDA